MLKKYRIPFAIDHIFNMPFEDEDSYKEAVRFYNQSRPKYILTNYLNYIPKTKMLVCARDAGIVTVQDERRIEEGFGDFRISASIGEREASYSRRRYSNYRFWMAIMPLVPPRFFGYLFTRLHVLIKRYPDAIALGIKFLGQWKAVAGMLMPFEVASLV